MDEFNDITEKLGEGGVNGHSLRREGMDSDWHEEELEEKKDDVREDVAYLEAAFDMFNEGLLPEEEIHRYAEDAKESYEELFKAVQKVHDLNHNSSGNIELEHTNYLRNFYVSTTSAVENEMDIPVADEEKLSSW